MHNPALQVVARIFNKREWEHLGLSQKAASGGLEAEFDGWLTKFFLPTVGEAVTQRRRAKYAPTNRAAMSSRRNLPKMKA